MVKEARELVRRATLGTILKVVALYPQGWLLRTIDAKSQKQAGWRTDPKQAAASACVTDIGTHAENLVRYITSLQIEELCADFTTLVEGRRLEDDANLMLRYKGGARGVLCASQISAGEENDFNIRVYGTKASLAWHQESPDYLVLKIPGCSQSGLAPWEPLRKAMRLAATRLPLGAPEAFANIYREAARAIRAEVNGDLPPENLDSDGRRWTGRNGVYYHSGSERKGRQPLGKNARLQLKFRNLDSIPTPNDEGCIHITHRLYVSGSSCKKPSFMLSLLTLYKRFYSFEVLSFQRP